MILAFLWDEQKFSALLLALFFSLLAHVLGKRAGFFQFPTRTLYPLALKYVLFAFGIYFAVVALLAPLALALIGVVFYGHGASIEGALTQRGFLLVQLSAIAATFIALCIFLALIQEQARTSILGGGEKRRQGIVVGLLSWLIAYPTTLFTYHLVNFILFGLFQHEGSEQLAIQELRRLMGVPALFIAAALIIAFVIPWIEELLFRGVLLTYLAARIGWTPGIVISSLLFALMHFSKSQGLSNIALLAALFVFSCYLGMLYRRTGSLIAPAALHSAFNATTVLLLLMGKESI